MSMKWKLGLFALLISIAYGAAWLKAYQLSKQYVEYASQELAQGNAIIALKGMNKLELRKEDRYFGGYQQVIETWESAIVGPKPSFYQQALGMPTQIIESMTAEQLEHFIHIYVELDSRYVPEVAERLQILAARSGNHTLATEMQEFLQEAFPYYKVKAER